MSSGSIRRRRGEALLLTRWGGAVTTETHKLAAILAGRRGRLFASYRHRREAHVARLRALRSDLIDPTIAVHRGRVVKRMGDGAIVEFRSVVDAVRCTIEVQNAMVDRNSGVPHSISSSASTPLIATRWRAPQAKPGYRSRIAFARPRVAAIMISTNS
jgi:class 3 adenylate cyclase